MLRSGVGMVAHRQNSGAMSLSFGITDLSSSPNSALQAVDLGQVTYALNLGFFICKMGTAGMSPPWACSEG